VSASKSLWKRIRVRIGAPELSLGERPSMGRPLRAKNENEFFAHEGQGAAEGDILPQ